MLVKWVNFPVEESTWEPLVDFGKCMSLLQEFEIEEFVLRGDNQILLSDFAHIFPPGDSDKGSSSSSMSPLPVSPEPPKVVKRKKKAPKKKKNNTDDDDDENSTLGGISGHRSVLMSPYKGTFGLARGLELDKVVHSFRVGDITIMFVKWKGYSGTDAVPLENLKDLYPDKVLEYFENMELRYE
ncbi:hypothetical protein KR032_002894 [Drosophila birchii]|nr:hypothetical protein KR032_002894 [Drosophila birchii]